MDFNELIREKFINIYNIDLSVSKNINIKDMIFPNYFNQKILNLNYENDYRAFEYCRIINKIFGFGKLSYYEIPEAKIEKNDIIFDCGANTGIFALYSAYKGKIVYAFEPSTLARHYLRHTQKYNQNIIIVPYGLSNENKKEYFNQADNPGASRLEEFKMPEYHKILYREKVDLLTIDYFVKMTGIVPDFIKMDIENGEMAALEGAIKTLKQYHPKCSISIHEDNIKNLEYIKSLFPFGYKFYIKEAEFYDTVLIGVYNE